LRQQPGHRRQARRLADADQQFLDVLPRLRLPRPATGHLDRHHHPHDGHPQYDLNGPPVVVPLAPAGSAYLLMTWEGQPVADEPQHGDCEPRPATIKVIPPDETTQISATWPTDPVCNHGHLTTGAFHPGRPPSQQ
jgi:hypothetical protein